MGGLEVDSRRAVTHRSISKPIASIIVTEPRPAMALRQQTPALMVPIVRAFVDGSLRCHGEMNAKNTVIIEYNDFVRDCHKNAASSVMPLGPKKSEASAPPPVAKQTEKSGPDLKMMIEETKPKTVGAEEARTKQRKEMQTEQENYNKRSAEEERQEGLRQAEKDRAAQKAADEARARDKQLEADRAARDREEAARWHCYDDV